jgi:alkylation response protein AidB-like acyl-CoA dehydrogenase
MVGNSPGRIDAAAPGTVAWAVTRSAIAAAQTAAAIFTNLSTTGRNPLERHLRDIQCSRIHPPAGQRRPARRRPPCAAPSFS